MANDSFDAALTGFRDQAAVDRWIAAHNARVAPLGGVWDPGAYDDEDEDEDIGLKEAFGLPDRLPPIRLSSEAELAAMARGAAGRASSTSSGRARPCR
jgi:hypothetical protein